MHSVSHSLALLLTHSLTHSLAHSLSLSLNHSIKYSLTHSLNSLTSGVQATEHVRVRRQGLQREGERPGVREKERGCRGRGRAVGKDQMITRGRGDEDGGSRGGGGMERGGGGV